MTTTYEKLGQYSATELPIAPSDVVITATGSDGIYTIDINMVDKSITITAV